MVGTGRYRARIARDAADVASCQRLRHLCFIEAAGLARRPGGLERDAHDAACCHVMIEAAADGALVCCYRLLPLASGRDIGQSHAALWYDLAGLEGFAGPIAEMGRFCVRPGPRDPDILRLAWAALTALADRHGTRLLFGCTSFPGTDAARHAAVFAMLVDGHVAPARWRPGIRAPRVIDFAAVPRPPAAALRQGWIGAPPLLRSYLAMGGWTSDHAVIDAGLGTLHVFTGLEIAAVPAARTRALRRLAPAPPVP